MTAFSNFQKLHDEIESVREKDLSLDDMEEADSSYLYEDRLQKKFVKVWNRLCQLKGRTTASGRPVERKFKYDGQCCITYINPLA